MIGNFSDSLHLFPSGKRGTTEKTRYSGYSTGSDMASESERSERSEMGVYDTWRGQERGLGQGRMGQGKGTVGHDATIDGTSEADKNTTNKEENKENEDNKDNRDDGEDRDDNDNNREKKEKKEKKESVGNSSLASISLEVSERKDMLKNFNKSGINSGINSGNNIGHLGFNNRSDNTNNYQMKSGNNKMNNCGCSAGGLVVNPMYLPTHQGRGGAGGAGGGGGQRGDVENDMKVDNSVSGKYEGLGSSPFCNAFYITNTTGQNGQNGQNGQSGPNSNNGNNSNNINLNSDLDQPHCHENDSENSLGENENTCYSLSYGRVQLVKLFADVSSMCVSERVSRVAVVTCGPNSLVEEVTNLCAHRHKGVAFDLHKEVFDY